MLAVSHKVTADKIVYYFGKKFVNSPKFYYSQSNLCELCMTKEWNLSNQNVSVRSWGQIEILSTFRTFSDVETYTGDTYGLVTFWWPHQSDQVVLSQQYLVHKLLISLWTKVMVFDRFLLSRAITGPNYNFIRPVEGEIPGGGACKKVSA